jgi:hypothetical protein
MGKLYVHHVGEAGATRDFPKTVYQPVELSKIVSRIDEQYRSLILSQLENVFPSGQFNVWGVPEGANNVVKNLQQGDYVLLIGKAEQIETNVYDGDIVALCEVKFFPRTILPDLSQALWGESKFPFIFFFNVEKLSILTWQILASDLDYPPTYFPRGQVAGIGEQKFAKWGSADSYITHIRQEYGMDQNSLLILSEKERQLNAETDEEQSVSTEEYVKARLVLRSILHEAPQLTDDVQREMHEISKPARSLAFKTDVRKIYDNRCAICGSGLVSPRGIPEVQSAHIYPRGKNGSDDPRNGVALCGIHHWALDNGWISFTDDHKVLVREDIPVDEDYEVLWSYAGKSIRLPKDKSCSPASIYLSAHRRLHSFEMSSQDE